MKNLNRKDTGLNLATDAGSVNQLKERLSSARDLRDGMVQLTKYLLQEPTQKANLHLIDPQVSLDLLLHEWSDYKAALIPEIADRLGLYVEKSGHVLDLSDGIAAQQVDEAIMAGGLGRKKASASETRLSPPRKQEEVFRVLLHEWLLGHDPVTSKWLADVVGCSYPTVANALEYLGPAIQRTSDRRVALKYFPERAWVQFLANGDRVRGTIRYTDRSGQPRSAESLIRRLEALELDHLGVGGVLGAKKYYPELDLVGIPRLDLSVHAPGKGVDLSFVRQLDPALEATRDPQAPIRLALHFVRREVPFFEPGSVRIGWADPVECLADLHELRLEGQAVDFMTFLTRNKEGPT